MKAMLIMAFFFAGEADPHLHTHPTLMDFAACERAALFYGSLEKFGDKRIQRVVHKCALMPESAVQMLLESAS